MAIGTVYPVATVSIQNALARHQVGIAMGAMNFFRSLGSALDRGGDGRDPLPVSVRCRSAAPAQVRSAPRRRRSRLDVADVFRWVFVSAAVCLALGLVAILAMEERPLRSTPAGSEPPGPAPAG